MLRARSLSLVLMVGFLAWIAFVFLAERLDLSEPGSLAAAGGRLLLLLAGPLCLLGLILLLERALRRAPSMSASRRRVIRLASFVWPFGLVWAIFALTRENGEVNARA